MVQARQFSKTHLDQHYTAALFRYIREFAVRFRSCCKLVCLDDKHRMKISEPGFPVAAAQCGRRVKVGTNFKVGDHDFTKFSTIPSVVLQNQIPENVSSSWYCGQVYVTLKEGATEPSSPFRHMAELHSILDSQHSRHYTQMEDALSDFTFTCGAPLQDLDLYQESWLMFMYEIMSVGNQLKNYTTVPNGHPIWVYCATTVDPNTKSDHYPQCTDCSGKPHIKQD